MDDRHPIVSEKDREHFRRLGQWERENHELALREHLALSVDERLRRSWSFARQFARVITRDSEAGSPSQIYERARRLGLYR